MTMTTFDIIRETTFKENLEKALANGCNCKYKKPTQLPVLYKYSSISKYVVDNLENHNISMSPVSSLNDYFDSSLYTSVSKTKGQEDADKLFEIANKANVKNEFIFINREEHARQLQKAYERDQLINFTSADYYGIKICSFTTDPKSILMWSHYADSNQGVCIGYDYSLLPEKTLLEYMLYPVAYSKRQIDLTGYLDFNKPVCEHSVDVALYAGALHKSVIWSYEKEWRVVCICNSESYNYMPIHNYVKPSSVILGYHWIKPLFNSVRYIQHIDLVTRLLDFCIKNNIPTYLTLPNIGEYTQRIFAGDANDIKSFIKDEFTDKYSADMQYYRVIHNDMTKIFSNRKQK